MLNYSYIYSFIKIFFLSKYSYNFKKSFFLKKQINFTKNKVTFKVFLFSFCKAFNLLFSFFDFKKFLLLISTIFSFNKNLLIIDYLNNYNYLPVTNNFFDKSSNKFIKFVKYFNVGVILYFNVKKKSFFFNKLFNLNLINVCFNKQLVKSKFDYYFYTNNSSINFYIIYLYILKIYLKVNNNYFS